VCYVFLQDWRATLVPAATIPVSLLGTFAVMMALGYSINMFTLFALVLAIGLVVDDAICVVERVIVLMNRENQPAKHAAEQAMDELSSALIATTLVLLAIFIPITFMGGITGKIYTQFAVTISVAVCFSTLNALSLSPAICATMLKPIKETHIWVLRWFNMIVQRISRGYRKVVRKLARKFIIFLLFCGFVAVDYAFLQILPPTFIPVEDQGIVVINVQLPEGATFARTQAVMDQVVKGVKETPGVQHATSIIGFSLFSGSGENTGAVFVRLNPWDERKDENLITRLFKKYISHKPSASKKQSAIVQQFNMKFFGIPDASVFAVEMPSIPGLGTSSGLDLRIQSLNDFDYQKLANVTDGISIKIMQHPTMKSARAPFKANTPNIYLDVNRQKAEAMKVPVSSVFSILENYLGSSYVGDVNFGTQINKVIMQSDSKYRMTPENINKMYVTSATGELVPLMALVDQKYILSPRQITRYNQYPAASITAEPAESSGLAMKATEELLKNLPPGYAYEWTGMSYQEKQNEGQIFVLISLAVIFAYLFLVAQYESWTIPVPVLMSVVAAVGGGLFGLWISGQSLSIYAQLGLVLLVGLAAKNAILIVEFAKDEHQSGASVYKAAMDGLIQRFRPVLMTAFTFILGMLPMVMATGAGAASRRALGVPVFYGMLIGTLAGLVLIPLFYMLVQSQVERYARYKAKKRGQVIAPHPDETNIR
ncbi:MAG: efflux RND transporter permease subunit, partial [Elusimicrobiaceae bacterium]|nr:efflux RND transporter permease subunit [Elusimicrobiaceae bacterium]